MSENKVNLFLDQQQMQEQEVSQQVSRIYELSSNIWNQNTIDEKWKKLGNDWTLSREGFVYRKDDLYFRVTRVNKESLSFMKTDMKKRMGRRANVTVLHGITENVGNDEIDHSEAEISNILASLIDAIEKMPV